MKKRYFDAVIFDLDGVITKTALVHSAAWKKMFDDFLREYYAEQGADFVEFTHKNDYLTYVDGKPRYKGVADFLASRNIELPYGDPSDEPDKRTVCGLGNRKNNAFNEVLEHDGVEVYESTVSFMKKLKRYGYHIGVASSSKNCENVLKTAGLLDLVETRVDGVVSAELGLKGKPQADIFTTAADNLKCSYDRCVVVEDAVSGVQAGKNGHFGLVLGIARENNENELYENGADIVVDDMSCFGILNINDWFSEISEIDQWTLTYHGYDPKKERSREALMTVGNGYFGIRGAMEETKANPANYPGTYMAGMYNRLTTKVSGRDIENEDFVNLPNWLPITFKIDDGEWFNPNNNDKLIDIERNLDLRNGQLTRGFFIDDFEKLQLVEVCSKRFASMKNRFVAASSYSIAPLCHTKKITIKSEIDGTVVNEGVERYKTLNSKHLDIVDQGVKDDKMFVIVKTNQSNHKVAEVVYHKIYSESGNVKVETEISEGKATLLITVDVNFGEEVCVEKIVAICSDKDDFVDDALQTAMNAIDKKDTYDSLLEQSSKEWDKIWKKIDIQIENDRWSQKLLRLHLYHLIVSMSPFNADIDASITARGLHGEAYRGHIFWDELFILPFYDLQMPQVAKSMLMYRYRRLAEARKYAEAHGYRGAMYPWQSGSNGREETQIVHLNPLTGEWGDDNSSLQRHVSLAIAYDIWDYYWITRDIKFLKQYGSEMFFEIARFWASMTKFNPKSNRFEIEGVMGPDEFHEQYPNAEKGGLKDNAYTNVMVAWLFKKCADIFDLIGIHGVDKKEIEEWQNIASKLNLVINNEGIIAQYDGYFDILELDWDAYRQKYGNIYRLDRILKAEGKSPDAYKVAKQADALMIFYNLNKEEVDKLLINLNYSLPNDYLQKNLQYYLNRTSHGSTLSRVVHSRLAAMTGNFDLSWTLYQDALTSDYNDIQGGTTSEGIHAGVMAGTVLIALNTFAGLNYRNEILHLNPNLPKQWKSMKFNLTFKGIHYSFEIASNKIKVKTNKKAQIVINGKMYNFEKELDCNR